MSTVPFQGIEPIWSTFPSAAGETRDVQERQPGVFEEIFRSAIETVKETDAEKNQAQYLMATGQLDNPAELTIAASKAQMSVELLVQLRNKALDAYSELTRINL